jgi:hypothetical protein
MIISSERQQEKNNNADNSLTPTAPQIDGTNVRKKNTHEIPEKIQNGSSIS